MASPHVLSFLENLPMKVLLDVRSPGEFMQGHIPGAITFPLFTDEERAQVGTLYKQVNPQTAVIEGLRIVGPKMASFVESALKLAPHKKIAVYCWRGGQRSNSMAWLLRQAGFEVEVLKGGYKAFRNWVLDEDSMAGFRLNILSGKTGSGKTAILKAMAALGAQILDLEGLAHHKGSSFGGIGQEPQPSVEHFQNKVAMMLRTFDESQTIWVENENQAIGKVAMTNAFWKKMHESPLIHLEVPMDKRVHRLVEEYGNEDKVLLKEGFERIYKRLGPQHCKAAIDAVEEGDLAKAAEIGLQYYDRAYHKGCSKELYTKYFIIYCFQSSAAEIAATLLKEDFS